MTSNFWKRPNPFEDQLDILGLVESWIMAAEDWLLGFIGVEQLSAQEAFEGIECWARLARCRGIFVEQSFGNSIFQILRDKLCHDDADTFSTRAIAYPDIQAWRAQAQTCWDQESENSEELQSLLDDFDALELVAWFHESYASNSPSLETTEFLRQVDFCRDWLIKHSALFVICEPSLRALAATIATTNEEAMDDQAAFQSALYLLPMLDYFDQLWLDMENVQQPLLFNQQLPLGQLKTDYRIPEMASASGAVSHFPTSALIFRWQDHSQKFEATLHLPAARSPGEDSWFEMYFGTGERYADPAIALVGQAVRFGGTGGEIQQRVQGDQVLVFVRLSINEFMSRSNPEVELFVGANLWENS